MRTAIERTPLGEQVYRQILQRIQAGAIPADKAGKDGVFTDAERGALNARNTDIAKLAPMFKDGTMRWTNWGDITSW